MPLKSKAQVRKYMELARKGEITQTQLREALHSTKFKGLPERVTPKGATKVGKIRDTKVIK